MTTVEMDFEKLMGIENNYQFVSEAYLIILKRQADELGRQHYLSQLQNGCTYLEVVQDICCSAEGKQQNDHGTWLNIIERKKDIRWFLSKTFRKISQYGSQNSLADSNAEEMIEGGSSNIKQNLIGKSIPQIIVLRNKETNAEKNIYGQSSGERSPTIWMDLTTSIEWQGGVVGIVRADLEIAKGLANIDENVRFSMQYGNGFLEIPKEQLQWLLNSENVVDAYMSFFNRYADQKERKGNINNINLTFPACSDTFYHPFQSGDVVFSNGWMDSEKERYFAQLKSSVPSIILTYLVYDIILVRDGTKHFYHKLGQDKFMNYVKWISYHCDFILYGGQTAYDDTVGLQCLNGWPTPPGKAVKFGTDVAQIMDDPSREAQLLKEMGINGDFVITVGSIEPRKNHETLYRAYLYALSCNEELAQLVICGKPVWRADELLNSIKRNPLLKDKVLCLTPTEEQLSVLYKHCRFTLLPSMYEGWSLTLPESLGLGKFCLTADTPPLREIGQDLVDYVHPFDVKGWAEKIVFYSKNDVALKQFEDRISASWPITLWKDSARMVYDALVEAKVTIKPKRPILNLNYQKPTIWYDLTLSYLHWQGGISGIVRTELTYARYLKKLNPETRFFAHYADYLFEVTEDRLLWLFNDDDLSVAYKNFQGYWKTHESQGTGHRNPFVALGCVDQSNPAYLDEFPDYSVILFVGIDYMAEATKDSDSRTKLAKQYIGKFKQIMLVQLIYDWTPILYAHCHLKATCDNYYLFTEHVSNNFDLIVYGGQTAMQDGVTIQKEMGWRSPSSRYIEFGSDIAGQVTSMSVPEEDYVLHNLGITRRFIMTVGTIEPRKNHEVLYKAYLILLERGCNVTDLPMLIIIGKPGWLTDDFLATFNADERLKGFVMILSPSDYELDVLYRRCMFTLLPSFYEGWSLTLPESLSRGKFCLTSDVPPLRETGRNLVDYINPLDPFAWADKILSYSSDLTTLSQKEMIIRNEWQCKTWEDSTRDLISLLNDEFVKSYYQVRE